MAIFIKRVQTVMSLSQMDKEAGVTSNVDGRHGPLSPVKDCAGRNMPVYGFASSTSTPRKYRRICSERNLAIIPIEEEAPRWSPTSLEDDIFYIQDAESDCIQRTLKVPSDQVVPMSIDSPGSSTGSAPHLSGDGSLLDTVLTAMWDECAAEGLFRYDLSACTTKKVPGKYGFVAQLNEGRATKKRPTEFRVDQVCQPFDESKFNFKKAYMQEVLFRFEPLTMFSADEEGAGSPAVVPDSLSRFSNDSEDPIPASRIIEAVPCMGSPNLVVINVSPIEYGHVLLVPRVLDNLTQLVDAETMTLALHFAKEADNPCLRVGYNSLGAYATINHLHFQAYYLRDVLPCERAGTAPLVLGGKTDGLLCCHKRNRDRTTSLVNISRLVGYPVRGFVLEVISTVSVAEGIAELARLVGEACVAMQRDNIPHNLIITDMGRRVFIWPQCFAERQAQGLLPEQIAATGVNPAVFEIAGHMLLKRQEDYDVLGEDEVAVLEVLRYASLPEEKFLHVAQMCFRTYCPC
ncbi:hypothetical protein CEUSTIGMA_g10234.t1 [Chlamydomonas eustigma]|uniref:GDP-D-glucose phosphorylase 1 n=1 Tax=Chlamydomonas eustigma TaxID=1157962 RepID=A0A250XIA6_9CHLO|nr:hypothetical protein CEUSTIGMA_g10234.t1 [Chlamydomonas eustigma]|eukprot:GAX82808.1 hypothetical protein CEUSTIGMA_g10234.t1 [Chlamydomonas eustigma]